MSKDFILPTIENDKLRITAYGNDNLGSSPCIIMVHGFKGFKDWGFGPYIGNYLSNAGFFVLTFNFSHNGVGDSLTEFTELDKFAKNTFSLEISELSQLIDAYKNGFFGLSNNDKIGLIGHSRGGAISLLASAIKHEVNAVSVWSSVGYLDRYSERQKEKWRKEGVFDVFNTRTKQKMSLNLSLLEDIEKHSGDLLNIEKAVRNLKRPLFIAQGEQDLAVSPKEAKQIYEWSDKSKTKLYLIPSTGHTFDIKHPFDGSNDKFDNLLKKTSEFFKTNLS